MKKNKLYFLILFTFIIPLTLITVKGKLTNEQQNAVFENTITYISLLYGQRCKDNNFVPIVSKNDNLIKELLQTKQGRAELIRYTDILYEFLNNFELQLDAPVLNEFSSNLSMYHDYIVNKIKFYLSIYPNSDIWPRYYYDVETNEFGFDCSYLNPVLSYKTQDKDNITIKFEIPNKFCEYPYKTKTLFKSKNRNILINLYKNN